MIQSKITKTLHGTWEEVLALKGEIPTNSKVQLLVYEPVVKKSDDIKSLRQAVIEDFHENYEFVREPLPDLTVPSDLYDSYDAFMTFYRDVDCRADYRRQQSEFEVWREDARAWLLALRETAKEYADIRIQNELTTMLELDTFFDNSSLSGLSGENGFESYISKIQELLEESRKVQQYRKFFPLFWGTAEEMLGWQQSEAKENYDEATLLELEPIVKEFSQRVSVLLHLVQYQAELSAKQEAFRSNLTNELEKITKELETFSQPSDASSEMIAKFKVCELACWVASLHAEAGELKLSGEATAPIQGVRSPIQNLDADYLRNHPIIGDESLCLSAERWKKLAYWYNRTAKAREVYEFHINHKVPLKPIIESVAAPVGGLRIVLDQCDKEVYRKIKDAYSTQFHDELLEYRTQYSLSFIQNLKQTPTLSPERLEPEAERLEYNLEIAKQGLKKQKCINNVKTLFSKNLHLGESEDTLEADRALLFPLLDECKNAGIEDSNSGILNCLLKHGRSLLEGEDKYAELLKSVIKRRVIKGKEIAPTEESETTEIDKPNLIVDSGDLWQRRAERWTRLDFCEVVEKQLKACETEISSIVERLSILEGYCTNYKGGGFRFEEVGAPVSPESDVTLKKYGKQRTFKCTDGTSRTFSWHIKPSQKLRIHFEFDPEKSRMWIGYIGRHLKTVSNPS